MPGVRIAVSPVCGGGGPAAAAGAARRAARRSSLASTPRASASGSATTSARTPAAVSPKLSPPNATSASHRHRRDGIAEKSGKRMDREGAAEPGRRNLRRQQRIVGGVKHRVGQSEQRHREQQVPVGRRQPERDEGDPGAEQRRDQHAPRPEPIDQKPDRQLRRHRDDIRDRQRQTKLDKPDPELRPSETGTAAAARDPGNDWRNAPPKPARSPGIPPLCRARRPVLPALPSSFRAFLLSLDPRIGRRSTWRAANGPATAGSARLPRRAAGRRQSRRARHAGQPTHPGLAQRGDLGIW